MPRVSPSLSTATSRFERLMPRRAARNAITVAQHDAREALKNYPGFGSDALPPIARGISVLISSPPGPTTRQPGPRPNSPRQFRPRHDSRLHRLHRHRVRNRAADAFLRERIQRLHLEPGIFVARAVEHIDAERQIVAGESPRAKKFGAFVPMRFPALCIKPR